MNTVALILAGLLFQSVAPAHAPKITQEMIASYLAQHYECGDSDSTRFEDLEYFNFTGHEYDDVIVVASTCESGTGGPDVHSVFSWIDEGKLGELEFEKVDTRRYDVLLGNRNYILRANKDDRELSEMFYDTSGRESPLTLTFQWDGKQHKFVLGAVHSDPSYKTSYDCAKAQEEVEHAICYVESLAKLDRDLGAVYSALTAKLSPTDGKSIVQDQRAWLARRNHDCVIYKGWVECLTAMYDARIDELKRATERPRSSPSIH